MDDLTRLTIAEVLAFPGRAAEVFGRRQMACVGCTMAPFDTVAEAARVYGVEPERLAAELGSAIDRGEPGATADDHERRER